MPTPRTLIAFAYVADQFTRTNDIAAGLIPLFAPLISARAGRPFVPEEFTGDVKAAYDLDMHPYAAEELAPALARAGYLEERRTPAQAVSYTNRECRIPETPLRDEQLQALIVRFCESAEPRLAKLDLSESRGALQEAFLDRLVRPDFLALVLRPDRPYQKPTTLTLGRANEGENGGPRRDEHLDYLVASFILELGTSNSADLDLLVAATSGALVAEVILDLQRPPRPGESFAGLDVALDSPLILDALDLGLERGAPYARQLIDQARRAGARPVVFESTIDEMAKALRSTLENLDRRYEVYGPLGRRLLHTPALPAYVRAIIPRLRQEVERLGIEVREVSGFDRASGFRFFSETNEDGLAARIGDYPSEAAREHDARAIADVLRLRGGARITTIGAAQIVFVTRNTRLARLSRRHLIGSNLISADYFPPCITDRYLAGLLWISTGGGGDTLSRLRLIANCSAATVPRRDIVSRMYRFIAELKPEMVERFDALMTNERAAHFLMDRTMADATLITPENFEEIYRDIEEAAAERVTQRKDAEIAELKRGHSEQIERLTQEHQGRFQEETTRGIQLAEAARRANEESAEVARGRDALAQQLLETETNQARACVRAGQQAGRIAIGKAALIPAAVAALSLFFGTASGTWAFLLFVATVLVTWCGVTMTSRHWPDNPLERWINKCREEAAISHSEEHGPPKLMTRFELDWKSGDVRLRRRLPNATD